MIPLHPNLAEQTVAGAVRSGEPGTAHQRKLLRALKHRADHDSYVAGVASGTSG
ncbi:hypothetical protein ACFWFI_16850 [Streptomyces sp. NPDC060209]|uniref:hypothetical protein n=1 Tax=Streptomyces sp. NPDC060209 TaxID=3347073 RepID=UPI00364D5C10